MDAKKTEHEYIIDIYSRYSAMERCRRRFENALKSIVNGEEYEAWIQKQANHEQKSIDDLPEELMHLIWSLATYTHYRYCDGKSKFPKQGETEPIYKFTMLNVCDEKTESLMKDHLYSFLDPCCTTCAYCLGGKCRLKYMYNGKCVGGDRDIPDKDYTVCQLWELDD